MTMKESKSMTKECMCGMTAGEATALNSDRHGTTFYVCNDHSHQRVSPTCAGEDPEGPSGCYWE